MFAPPSLSPTLYIPLCSLIYIPTTGSWKNKQASPLTPASLFPNINSQWDDDDDDNYTSQILHNIVQ